MVRGKKNRAARNRDVNIARAAEPNCLASHDASERSASEASCAAFGRYLNERSAS
jgi:hypothetical protein